MISGRYFDGHSATAGEARIEFGADGVVRVHGLAEPVAVPLGQVNISDRVGNITRRVTFPGGAVFETFQNDAMDRALEVHNVKRATALVHWLEARWPVALGSLVAVALVSFAFLRWGVPALADWTAKVLPTATDRAIGSGSLDVLDRVAFRKSELSDARQKELRARFALMTRDLKDGHAYELELRHGAAIGANAFALPSGIVVMTDELVEMSKTDDELVAVLAHEIGHVRGRHALRQLLQAAGVSAIALALLGDVSSISGLLSAAPALLHAKHSRDFEREADAFGKKWLREHNIAESNFDAILCRMSEEHPGSGDVDYFSSHPATSERAHCTPAQQRAN
ncbi:MAG: M48 family metallopeptidase [Pseudomonadota bacterium]